MGEESKRLLCNPEIWNIETGNLEIDRFRDPSDSACSQQLAYNKDQFDLFLISFFVCLAITPELINRYGQIILK